MSSEALHAATAEGELYGLRSCSQSLVFFHNKTQALIVLIWRAMADFVVHKDMTHSARLLLNFLQRFYIEKRRLRNAREWKHERKHNRNRNGPFTNCTGLRSEDLRGGVPSQRLRQRKGFRRRRQN